ncbi:probable metal-nicotianamine transporter YSL6 [Fagus crenata]
MGTEGASVEISEPLLVSETQQIKPIEEEPKQQIPEWKDQITIRGLAVSALLGNLFCIITHKLNLTVEIIPSLNVDAGTFGFGSHKRATELKGCEDLGFTGLALCSDCNTLAE